MQCRELRNECLHDPNSAATVRRMLRRRILFIPIEFPRATLAAWLILCAVVSAGAARLEFDFSPESVYAGQDGAVEFCEQHKKLFRFEDSNCLVVLQATDGQTLLRSECFEWVREFGAQAADLPGIVGVSSLLTLERPRIDFTRNLADGAANAVVWGPVVSENDLSSPEAMRDRVERIPLLNDLLISRDRRLMMVLVALDPTRRGIQNIEPSVAALEKLLRDLPLPRNTRTHLTGVPPIRVDIIRSLLTDQTVMVPCCGSLFVALSLVMFRNVPVTLLSLLAVMSSVGMTVGIMGWTGQPFNLLSNVVPPLTLIIAAANCVHIVSHFRGVLTQSDATTRDVTRVVMSEMAVTCFLTLATTAIGFGSLLLARSTLLQTLAAQAVLGMVCNYFGLMLVLTSGLVLLGDRLRPDADLSESPGQRRTTAMIDAVYAWMHRVSERALRLLCAVIVRRSRLIIAVHLVAAAVALWWSSDMRVNSRMFETYDADHPVMQTIDLLDTQLSGMVSLELNLRAPESDDFFRPDVAAAVRRIRSTAEKDSRITFCRDYTQILAAFDSRITSTDPERVSDALGRISRVIKRLDVSRVTRDFIAQDEPAARIMMRVHDIGSAGLTELIADLDALAKKELPPDIQSQVTGDAALHAICMGVFVHDLLVSLITASAIIFALIGILFRSFRIGLISALPNLLPLVITLAWMKLRGFELTAGNVIVFSISVGIAADDTIHFLARFNEESRSGRSPRLACVSTIRSTGRAIILTSVLIVCGLSILIFSDFVPTRRFAELTAITMVAALPGDLILLPALLAAGKRHHRNKRKHSERLPLAESASF